MSRIIYSVLSPFYSKIRILNMQPNLFVFRAITRISYDNKQYSSTGNYKYYRALLGVAAATTLYATLKYRRHQCDTSASPQRKLTPGDYDPGLRTYSEDEVNAHNNVSTGVWVVYKEGIYDITQFIAEHPGGDQILMAAGASIEPFWKIYPIHDTEEVFEMLEELRIGNIKYSEHKIVLDSDDPFANEPKRHSLLKVNSLKPFNAEPPESLLIQAPITPVEIAYIRNHLPTPLIDIDKYSFSVEGRDYCLTDLQNQFKTVTISAALQCAGNRRSDMSKIKKVKGLNWSNGAIYTAEWTGVKLRDVLLSLGKSEAELRQQYKHVQFEGCDCDATKCYGASIPIQKALNNDDDVILAWLMNSEPLTRDHGYPLRVVIPGTVAARSVKWLKSIKLSLEESSSHWQQNDYKILPSSFDPNKENIASFPSIQEMPVQSAICIPQQGDTFQTDEQVTFKGYAWSGGGRDISRVELSIDEGVTWQPVEITNRTSLSGNKQWGWSFWESTLSMPNENRQISVLCRAVDNAGNTQTRDAPWNIRGLLSNSWHRITINVCSNI